MPPTQPDPSARPVAFLARQAGTAAAFGPLIDALERDVPQLWHGAARRLDDLEPLGKCRALRHINVGGGGGVVWLGLIFVVSSNLLT